MKSPSSSAPQAQPPTNPTARESRTVLPESAQESRADSSGGYRRWGKRLLDLACLAGMAPVALALAAPIAVWNALVFRDPRRILFVQERIGRGGRPFRILKFRTMKDAPTTAADSWFAGHDRARVTRFGRFLRNTHLDELPQLINVARGDMHLIGPRPEMREVHEWACGEVPGFEERLAIRPGLTGRAQITQGYTQASEGSYARKLAIDLDYIEGLTLWSDLSILMGTVPWVLRGRGWAWNQGLDATDESAEAVAGDLDEESEEVVGDIVPRGATVKPSPRPDMAETRR